MSDGRGRPTAPSAGGLGPRIAACALVAGVGVLVALLLTPGIGGRTAAGEENGKASPTATATRSGDGIDDEFQDRLPTQDQRAKLADIEELRIDVGGVVRKALVYIPSGVRSDAPAFVAVHGYTGSAPAMIRRTSYIDLAERNGWILAFPQGLKYADGQNAWNAGSCCGGAPTAGTSDVKFITTLGQRLVSQYHADPSRLFFHGYSNGAMLGYRVACQTDQPFSGFALLSGTLVSPCRKTSRVPILAVHGLRDGTVPFSGSRWRVSLQTELPPVTKTIDTMATLNGCKGKLSSRTPKSAAIRVYSAKCPASATVQLVTVSTMSHQWTEDSDRYGINETTYSTKWLLEHN